MLHQGTFLLLNLKGNPSRTQLFSSHSSSCLVNFLFFSPSWSFSNTSLFFPQASLHTDVLPAYAFGRAASINYITTLLPSCNFPRLQHFTTQKDQDVQTPLRCPCWILRLGRQTLIFVVLCCVRYHTPGALPHSRLPSVPVCALLGPCRVWSSRALCGPQGQEASQYRQ